MDFRNITGITIPAGRVNKISIGGVVYWNKAISAGNKESVKFSVYRHNFSQ